MSYPILKQASFENRWLSKSMFGTCSTPWPARLIYKSNVECIFLNRNNGQMTSIFNTNRKYPRMHVYCKIGDSSPNVWRVVAQTSHISHNSESKWPKWPWRSRSMTSILNTDQEYPRMHVCCKFDDSSPKSVMSCNADKPNFLEFSVKKGQNYLEG